MKKYVVIGGQYCYRCYGSSDSLQGAKMIATKHVEYWDNWQGWHVPDIYNAEDVKMVDNCVIKCFAKPVAVREYKGKWHEGV